MHLFTLFGRRKAKPEVIVAARDAHRPVTTPMAPDPISTTTAATTVAAPPTPRDLRRLIFAAVASNDSERLATMFREDPDAIVGHAVDWMEVPDALKPNPAAVRWYGQGLCAVAQYCAERLNQPDLFKRLEELGLSNPVVQ